MLPAGMNGGAGTDIDVVREFTGIVVDQESTLPPSSPENSMSRSGIGAKKPLGNKRDSKLKKGQKIPQIDVPTDAFVTINADTGRYQSRFRILPYSRSSSLQYSGSTDKLSKAIMRGGGLVVNGDDDKEGQLSPKESENVIKILDVEYVRENIQETQDMMLPYDCFSSSFVWNQIYQRSNYVEKRDADLNQYRLSPSAYVHHDANGIFQGVVTWNDVQPISSDKLLPAIRIKDVALQLFPELIVCPRRSSSRTRRVYSRRESQLLLNKVCEVDGHLRVLGVSLYEEIAETQFLDRTSSSLREHFIKTILPHILSDDGYYTILPVDSVQFKRLNEKRRETQFQYSKKRARQEEGHDSEDA